MLQLSELEDGVEQYKEQKTSSLQTAVRSTEVVADLMTPEDKELIDVSQQLKILFGNKNMFRQY